jgi:death-on-curing protein
VTLVFLSVAAVEAIHKEQIELFGGADGLRDAGLLESAVMRAEFKAKFDGDASLAAIAASLGYGLIKNHAFVDGNKRVGLAAIVALLKLNGFMVKAPQAEKIAMVWHAAASEISEEEFAAWVERSVVPL